MSRVHVRNTTIKRVYSSDLKLTIKDCDLILKCITNRLQIHAVTKLMFLDSFMEEKELILKITNIKNKLKRKIQNEKSKSAKTKTNDTYKT